MSAFIWQINVYKNSNLQWNSISHILATKNSYFHPHQKLIKLLNQTEKMPIYYWHACYRCKHCRKQYEAFNFDHNAMKPCDDCHTLNFPEKQVKLR